MRKSLHVLALITLLAPAGLVAQQTDVALVYRLMMDGRAIVSPAAGAAQHVAQLGERLRGGDVVLTSENTRAAIRFTDDGSVLRLNPSSRLQVRMEGSKNAVVKTLELEFGELWTKVNRRDGSQYRVQTPAGVAAVKGTEFIVRVGANGETTVITLEGVVEFFNRAGTTEVRAGRRTAVTNQDQAPVTVETRAEDVEQYKALIDADSDGGSDDEPVEIEVVMQNAEGQTRSVIMVVPRRALKALLQGGR